MMDNYYQVGGRLTAEDIENVDKFKQYNNPNYPDTDAKSFSYEDVIRHIPVQRSYHQTASYAYRTNQYVKHAYEDGHMSYDDLITHTDRMYNMNDKEAFSYAKNNLKK